MPVKLLLRNTQRHDVEVRNYELGFNEVLLKDLQNDPPQLIWLSYEQVKELYKYVQRAKSETESTAKQLYEGGFIQTEFDLFEGRPTGAGRD